MKSRPPLTPALARMLVAMEELGPATSRQISEAVKRSPHTVKEQLHCLVTQGWAEAEPTSENKRTYLYTPQRTSYQ